MNTNDKSIPTARELQLRLGETILQRIRFNLAWYALRFFMPELFQLTGVSKSLILLNLSRKEIRSAVLRPLDLADSSDGDPGKGPRFRQQGLLFRY